MKKPVAASKISVVETWEKIVEQVIELIINELLASYDLPILYPNGKMSIVAISFIEHFVNCPKVGKFEAFAAEGMPICFPLW